MQLLIRNLLLVFIIWLFFLQAAYSQSTTITKAFLTGRYNYARDTTFKKVPGRYSEKDVYLKKAAYNAFLKMYVAAAKDGVRLTIISGTRSFGEQESIWERKWNDVQGIRNANLKNVALAVLRWSSMPGTSRHHWGTDMDLVSLKKAYYETSAGKKTYAWLCNNAAKFGFVQPFNAGRTEGYQEEKWHWSYLPLAKVYLKEYIKQISYADISGFEGHEAAPKLDVIKSQVLAINLACK